MKHEEDTYSVMFSSLKHPIRRRILAMLSQEPLSYTNILKHLGVESGVLTYHLDKLGPLISKNENDRYVLSEFGKAAAVVTAGVESSNGEISKYRHGFSTKSYLTIFIAAIILVSFGYGFYSYNILHTNYTNSVVTVMIDGRGDILESLIVLNSTLEKGNISTTDLYVLYKNLVQLSSNCKFIASFDVHRAEYWLQIKEAIDSTADFTHDWNNKITIYKINGLNNAINYNSDQKTSVNNLKDDLKNILNTFPKNIDLGNLNFQINSTDLSIAADTSRKMLSDII